MDWRALKPVEALKELDSGSNGLSEAEVKTRLEKEGFNELKEKSKVTPLKVFLRQFTNFILWVLFAAALISYFIGETLSFLVVLLIIGVVIVLGFVQEYKAERVMAALKDVVQPITKVLRSGKVREVQTREVVPGDILLLEAGDKIPADAKVLELITLKVDEAALTGESAAVDKSVGDLIFAGTQITNGKCKALVVATGMRTKLGGIARLIQETEEKTPLQEKMEQLARNLALIALAACSLTFALGVLKGAPLAGILVISLALAVAAVPEGLPLTLTLTLAYGMNRMAKHNAVVRKMLGVETLGSTTVICTDKTGTLTKNEMTVEKIFVDGGFFEVSGAGFEPKGGFTAGGGKINAEAEKNLSFLLKGVALCNNAVIEEREGKWESVGDPTEIALVVAAAKAGLWKDALEREFPRVEEIMFTSERKIMSTVHEKGGGKIAFVKGAPEIVLKKCGFADKNGRVERLARGEAAEISRVNNELTDAAFRVLAVAYKKISGALDSQRVENDLVFLGLVAMMDVPREGVTEAVDTCGKAGIKVVMITGDNEKTAMAVGRKIGLVCGDRESLLNGLKDEKLKRIVADGAITGSELDELRDEELDAVVEKVSVYARVMPEQKLRIIDALKRKGHIVAMTGDGVNDAPALKKADIGIAMGIKGTDVAKESSVMILQDDNFSTIVEAVKRGRTIYDNIEKFTCYLISRNFTEVILIILGIALLGFDFLPLIALQILFINTFDEILPAVALGLDPARAGVMSKKPRKPGEKILKKRNLVLILCVASFMALSSFWVFLSNDPASDIGKARTMTFATITSMILFVPFAFRSLDESVFKIGILSNKLLIAGAFVTLLLTLSALYVPALQRVFELSTLGLTDWIVPLLVSLSVFAFIEVMKAVTRKAFPA
ncbi:MAG: cation-translocating P-type ATPase [Candidatus Micrarchaeota archaeon]